MLLDRQNFQVNYLSSEAAKFANVLICCRLKHLLIVSQDRVNYSVLKLIKMGRGEMRAWRYQDTELVCLDNLKVRCNIMQCTKSNGLCVVIV